MTRDAGFTLVEVLMAAVTAALLFAAFSAPLRGGRVVWARTMDGLEGLSQQRAVLDRVAQDLTNAVAFPTQDDAQPAVRFEARHLQFYTVRPGPTDDRPAGLWWVEYVMEETPDGRVLVRRARPFQTRRDAGAADTVRQRLAGVEDVTFRYGYRDPDRPSGLRWSAVWEEEDAVPRYVEVTVQSSGQQPVRHLLQVPAGALKMMDGAGDTGYEA